MKILVQKCLGSLTLTRALLAGRIINAISRALADGSLNSILLEIGVRSSFQRCDTTGVGDCFYWRIRYCGDCCRSCCSRRRRGR